MRRKINFLSRCSTRKFRLGVLVILAGCLTIAATRHEYHVSITQVDYNPRAQSLEIAVKIFTDDLEVALEKLGAPPIYLGSNREYAKTDSLIDRYLQNRLHFLLDEVRVKPRYLGKEIDLDATWCYLEVTQIEQPRKFEIQNRILLERFDDQANLVHIHVADHKESMILRKGKATEIAYFEE